METIKNVILILFLLLSISVTNESKLKKISSSEEVLRQGCYIIYEDNKYSGKSLYL